MIDPSYEDVYIDSPTGKLRRKNPPEFRFIERNRAFHLENAGTGFSPFHGMRGFQGFQGIGEIPNICIGVGITNIGTVPNFSSLSMMNSQIKSDQFLGFYKELLSQINKNYHQCVGPSVDNQIPAWLPSNTQSYPL